MNNAHLHISRIVDVSQLTRLGAFGESRSKSFVEATLMASTEHVYVGVLFAPRSHNTVDSFQSFK